LHKISNRATPRQVGLYEIALNLFKTFILILAETELIHLNWNQTDISRKNIVPNLKI
jgi:hypothetical protein